MKKPRKLITISYKRYCGHPCHIPAWRCKLNYHNLLFQRQKSPCVSTSSSCHFKKKVCRCIIYITLYIAVCIISILFFYHFFFICNELGLALKLKCEAILGLISRENILHTNCHPISQLRQKFNLLYHRVCNSLANLSFYWLFFVWSL